MTPKREPQVNEEEEVNANEEAAKAAFIEAAEAKAAEAVEVDEVADAPPEAEVDEVDEPSATDAEWDAAVDSALDAGLSEEDIKGFDTPAALTSAATLLARTTKSGEDSADGEVPDGDKGTELIEWEYLDPDVAEALKAIQAGHAREVADLTRKLDEVSGTVKEQFSIAAEQRFGGYITDLDKPYQKLFESAANQTKLRDEMDVLRDGYRSRNREVPAENELFTKALNSSFSSELKKIDADRVKRSVKAR